MTDLVLLTIYHDIATVTLNRPEVHNAFNADMIAALSDTFDQLAQRDDLRAVVLRGEGKSFSAGADINWMKDSVNYSKDENHRDALALAKMLNTLCTLPQLSVACVQGAAMGGGLGLVSCCDIALAAPEAKFALSEVKLGLIPATIAPYVIQSIGNRHARRFFQTGERFGAKKAYDIGLVHEVGDIDSLLSGLLEEITKNGSHAMREAKKLCLDLGQDTTSESVMSDTADRIAAIRTTEEAQARLKNFLRK